MSAATSLQQVDQKEGDLESIRRKSENLITRCVAENAADDAKKGKCRTIYDDLEAEGNTYWSLYKTTFADRALAGALQDDLKARANAANAKFVELRDLVVPAPEQAHADPATITAIIQIGTALYEAYRRTKEADRARVQARIFQAIDKMMFEKWDKVIPATQHVGSDRVPAGFMHVNYRICGSINHSSLAAYSRRTVRFSACAWYAGSGACAGVNVA